MKILGMTSGFVFSNNPIVIYDDPDPDFGDDSLGIFSVSQNLKKIYEGRIDPRLPIEIDISDIIDSNASNYPDYSDGLDEALMQIEDRQQLAKRIANVSVTYSMIENECEFIALPGGISRQAFKRQINRGIDILNHRFLNPKCNFFFTTRTSGWLIPIKETELTPLFFIIPNDNTEIKIVERCSNQEWIKSNLRYGLYAIDINRLRFDFFDEWNVFASVLDVYVNNQYSCRIVIEETKAVVEHCLLKFRNSLAVFEKIDLIGSVKATQNFNSDGETDTYDRFDRATYAYSKKRKNVEVSHSLNISTTIDRNSDLNLLIDMLASKEVYLNVNGSWKEVIPSTEDFTYDGRITGPVKLTINLEYAETDDLVTDEYAVDAPMSRPRIFTKQFSKHFC